MHFFSSISSKFFIRLVCIVTTSLFFACFCSGCYSLQGRIGEVQYAFSEKEAPGDYYSLEDEGNTPITSAAPKPVIPMPDPVVQNPSMPANDSFPEQIISAPVTTSAPVIPDDFCPGYISAVNALGYRFLKTLPDDYTGSFSPPMLSMMMSMMLYSANEPASAAIHTAMDTDMSIVDLQGSSALLRKKLALDNVNIRLAMILNTRVDQDEVFDQVVADKAVAGYDADIHAYDYRMTHYVVSEVNRWMNSGTEGHIKTTITQPLSDAKLSLFGSACIDPLWDGDAFQDAYYSDETFTNNTGTHAVSMLNTEGIFHEAQYNGGTLLSIPSNHHDLCCIFGKAPSGKSASEFALEVLTNTNIVELIHSMPESTFRIAIPRISEYAAINCSENLRSLGLGDCMDGGAGNFANLTIPETYTGLPTISELYAGTAVVLDETTRSATLEPISVYNETEGSSVLTPENAVIKMDSPFFVAVIHNETKCLVSLSVVNEPQ